MNSVCQYCKTNPSFPQVVLKSNQQLMFYSCADCINLFVADPTNEIEKKALEEKYCLHCGYNVDMTLPGNISQYFCHDCGYYFNKLFFLKIPKPKISVALLTSYISFHNLNIMDRNYNIEFTVPIRYGFDFERDPSVIKSIETFPCKKIACFCCRKTLSFENRKHKAVGHFICDDCFELQIEKKFSIEIKLEKSFQSSFSIKNKKLTVAFQAGTLVHYELHN